MKTLLRMGQLCFGQAIYQNQAWLGVIYASTSINFMSDWYSYIYKLLIQDRIALSLLEYFTIGGSNPKYSEKCAFSLRGTFCCTWVNGNDNTML